jgi:hypothetical protein
MKTQPIMNTHIIESTTSNYKMESFCVDSMLELICVDSKSKSSKSTLADFGVESLVRSSKLKLL